MEDLQNEVQLHQEEHDRESAAVLVAQVVVLAIIVLTYFLSSRDWLKRVSVFAPASTFMIALGIVAGFIIRQMQDEEREFFEFNPEFFFRFLLPPIILGAGYSVRKDHFFHNFGSILLFAFLGTALSAAFIGIMTWAVGVWFDDVYGLDLINSMVLGSLLSAVDPISIVVVLKSLGVDENLYVLIFGEAVLNDAVAIVINRVFVSIADHTDTIGSLPRAIGEIIGISLGSIAIGLVIGFLGAYIHRKSGFRDFPHLEVGLFFVIAYMPYEIAELAHLSGIMAILFAGIVADYYTSYSLSTAGETTVREVIELVSFVAESFVFTSLGMTIALFPSHNFQIGLIAFALLWCLLARIISVFPLAAILNTKRKHQISFKYQIVMFMSGLRGPVAFALSMAVPLHRDVIVTTTLAIAMVTTIVFGGAAMPVLTRLNLTEGAEFEVEQFVDANELFPTKYTHGGGGPPGKKRSSTMKSNGTGPVTPEFSGLTTTIRSESSVSVVSVEEAYMQRQRMGEFSTHRDFKRKPQPAPVKHDEDDDRELTVVRPLEDGAAGVGVKMGSTGRRGGGDGDGLDDLIAINVSDGANTNATLRQQDSMSGVQMRSSRVNGSVATSRKDYDESRHWFNRLHQKYLKDMFRARQHKMHDTDTLLSDVQPSGHSGARTPSSHIRRAHSLETLTTDKESNSSIVPPTPRTSSEESLAKAPSTPRNVDERARSPKSPTSPQHKKKKKKKSKHSSPKSAGSADDKSTTSETTEGGKKKVKRKRSSSRKKRRTRPAMTHRTREENNSSSVEMNVMRSSHSSPTSPVNAERNERAASPYSDPLGAGGNDSPQSA